MLQEVFWHSVYISVIMIVSGFVLLQPMNTELYADIPKGVWLNLINVLVISFLSTVINDSISNLRSNNTNFKQVVAKVSYADMRLSEQSEENLARP
jgi:hypothetical protein